MQNLPISGVCIENQGMFFYAQDTAPKSVINKWWIQPLFPQKCKARGREPYPSCLSLSFWCVQVHAGTCVHLCPCMKLHGELSVTDWKYQWAPAKCSSYAVFPPLQAYCFLFCRLPPTTPLAVEGEQHPKENTGGEIKSCWRGDYRSVILEQIHYQLPCVPINRLYSGRLLERDYKLPVVIE